MNEPSQTVLNELREYFGMDAAPKAVAKISIIQLSTNLWECSVEVISAPHIQGFDWEGDDPGILLNRALKWANDRGLKCATIDTFVYPRSPTKDWPKAK